MRRMAKKCGFLVLLLAVGSFAGFCFAWDTGSDGYNYEGGDACVLYYCSDIRWDTSGDCIGGAPDDVFCLLFDSGGQSSCACRGWDINVTCPSQ
jgi:hypothetical protein